MRLVPCSPDRHAKAILGILNDAIITSTALYDYKPRSFESMIDWFKARQSEGLPVLGVEDQGGELMGFASYGVFRPWPAYKYSVEHSVYVHKDHRRKGVGVLLMRQLILAAKAQGYHVMVGAIDVNNAASVALHQKLGFTHAGTIRQAGFKFGQWLDLCFYQLILETPEHPLDG
jgi:L-amino acid N-acyltransferase YncA